MERKAELLVFDLLERGARGDSDIQDAPPPRTEALTRPLPASPALAAVLLAWREPASPRPPNLWDLSTYLVYDGCAVLERSQRGIVVAATCAKSALEVAAAHHCGGARHFNLAWGDSTIEVHYLLDANGLFL
jgi:hypothetical protein